MHQAIFGLSDGELREAVRQGVGSLRGIPVHVFLRHEAGNCGLLWYDGRDTTRCTCRFLSTSGSDALVQTQVERKEKMDWERNLKFAVWGAVQTGWIQHWVGGVAQMPWQSGRTVTADLQCWVHPGVWRCDDVPQWRDQELCGWVGTGGQTCSP